MARKDEPRYGSIAPEILVGYDLPPKHLAALSRRDYSALCEVPYEVIATLGDDPSEDSIGLTCSMDAAIHCGKTKSVLPCPTFEDAAEAVKEGMATALLVPGAYPEIKRFIRDKSLVVTESFIRCIPPIVLVGLGTGKPSSAQILFLHKALDELLPEIGIDFSETNFVSSNSEACRKLQCFSGSALALTTQLCANHFNLTIYKVLRGSTAMPWIVFTKTK